MAPKRTRSSTSLDLSRASPVLESSVNLGNDPGSTTKGVGTTKSKSKLVRSGSGNGSGQGTLGFSSRKNTPVTPVKGKGVKRTVTEVDDVEERAVHPIFAAARKGEETKLPEMTVEAVDVDAQSPSLNGISGVPTDNKWDPLLLHSTTDKAPTKEMQQNLNIHTIPPLATLDSSPEEQTEEQDSMTEGRRTVRGLAVRKAMLRADEKIKALREGKDSAGGKKAAAAGKVKGGLNPNDKRWGKVYKAAWQSMGGDDITPSTFLPPLQTVSPRLRMAFFQFIRPRKPTPRSTISSVSLIYHRNTAHASGSRGWLAGSAQKHGDSSRPRRYVLFLFPSFRGLLAYGICWCRSGRYWRPRRERRMFRIERQSLKGRGFIVRPLRRCRRFGRLWAPPACPALPSPVHRRRLLYPILCVSFFAPQIWHSSMTLSTVLRLSARSCVAAKSSLL